MSQPTEHGDNIANQIQTEDAYGYFNPLTEADVWNVLDNLHTHFLDSEHDNRYLIMEQLENWMRELESMDGELPPE